MFFLSSLFAFTPPRISLADFLKFFVGFFIRGYLISYFLLVFGISAVFKELVVSDFCIKSLLSFPLYSQNNQISNANPPINLMLMPICTS